MGDVILGALLVLGSAFVFLGSLGLCKLPDAYSRLHAPTKATTLGLGALLVASAVEASRREGEPSVHELLVVLFMFLTAPISAYLLASAALHQRLPSRGTPLPDRLEEGAQEQTAEERAAEETNAPEEELTDERSRP